MNLPRRLAHRFGPLLGYAAASAMIWHFWHGPLRVISDWLPFGFGLLCGFAVAVSAATLWVFFAGPLQEWVREQCFDPPQPAFAAHLPTEGLQGVLVSDLHIDTWEYSADNGSGGSERGRRFLSLLAAIKADPTVDSFYLNGDLMDIPLHPDANAPEALMLRLSAALGQEQGVLLSRYDSVLQALLGVTVPEPGQTPIRRAIFQTGNHDIGVSGLRYVRSQMPAFLPPVQAVWNPSLLQQTDVNGLPYPRWVYIEHGHHWDPLLWLYMRYALLDTLRYGHRRREGQLISGMQRRGKVGMGAQTFVPASELLPAPPPHTQAMHFPHDQSGFAGELLRLRYRQAARRLFREFQSQGDDKIKTIVIGHTHHPDRYVFPGGGVYVNSGDWSGYTDHCAYCVLDPDGGVRGPFQWEDAANAEFGTPPGSLRLATLPETERDRG